MSKQCWFESFITHQDNEMKIGFYGSSLCGEITNKHCQLFYYSSYISKLKSKYNAEICHYGVKGCGYWDVILIQYKELLKNPPDIAVFIWPINHTLFNRKHRAIHTFSKLPDSKLESLDKTLWNSVCHYYNDLYDLEKDIQEYKSALYYFDKEILSKLESVKIIHFWEAGILNSVDIDFSNSNFIKNIEYPMTWSTGVEFIFPMLAFSAAGQWPRRKNFEKIFVKDPRCNHFEGDFKNTLLCNWISDAIDNYQKGCKIDKTEEIVEIYSKLSLGVAPVGGL